jgi:hypothetical protein
MGSLSGNFFEEYNKNAVVVGFNVFWKGGNHDALDGIQPIYISADGKRFDGRAHGPKNGSPNETVAKPGYIVGGLIAKSDGRARGLKVVYVKPNDPKDRYEGEWIGSYDGTERDIEIDGPVIGVYGYSGQDLDCFGLIFNPMGDVPSPAAAPPVAQQPTTPVPPAAKSAEDAKPAAADIPADVEAELKKVGWTGITGKWKKIGPGAFEVTDGHLEAAFLNGTIDVVMDRETKANVCLYARCSPKYKRGYGWIIREGKQKTQVLALDSQISGGYRYIYNGEPVLGFDVVMPPRDRYLRAGVTVNGQTIELTLNDKREHKEVYPKMASEGPMRIVVHGTATLVNPRCAELK